MKPTSNALNMWFVSPFFQDFVDSLMETRKKSLEYCQFPGFRHGELIELPGQLESPPILHRVTKAQDFNVSLYTLEHVLIIHTVWFSLFLYFFTGEATCKRLQLGYI